MIEKNKIEFFVATQAELFLIIIFIALIHSTYFREQIVLTDENNKLVQRKNDSLATVNKKLKAERDSLYIELTGTGIGNCLNRGFLCEVTYRSNNTYDVMLYLDPNISGVSLPINQSRNLTIKEFLSFGETVLNYSKNQKPECRFSIILYDNVSLSKQQLKNANKICNKYFNTSLK